MQHIQPNAFAAFIESDVFDLSALGEMPRAITHERLDVGDDATQRALVPALALILELPPLPVPSRTYPIRLRDVRGWGHLRAWWGRVCALWLD
jgi:hypothetical protein